jgi:branched-chain amino acid transport system permease protein
MILRPEGLFGEREIFRRTHKKRLAAGPPEPLPATTEAEAVAGDPEKEKEAPGAPIEREEKKVGRGSE